MNSEFITILKKLVTEQGKEILFNTAKCKAFLADYTHGEYKKESRLLMQTIEVGVPKAIDTLVLVFNKLEEQTTLSSPSYEVNKLTSSNIVTENYQEQKSLSKETQQTIDLVLIIIIGIIPIIITVVSVLLILGGIIQ